MTRPQTSAGIAVEKFVEHQTISPERILLKFLRRTKDRTLAITITPKNPNHTISNFPGHVANFCASLIHKLRILKVRPCQFEVAKSLSKLDQRFQEQIRRRKPDRPAPVRISTLDLDVRVPRRVLHFIVRKRKWILFVKLGEAADSVGREELFAVEKASQNARQLGAIHD